MKDFNNLLKEIGLTRKEFAQMIGITYNSMGAMLVKGKPVPKWKKSALIVADRLNKTREFLKERIDYWENCLIIEKKEMSECSHYADDYSDHKENVLQIEFMIYELKMILESENKTK